MTEPLTCSSPTDGCLLPLGCAGIWISTGAGFVCEYWGKEGREHSSLPCVIHHCTVSPFSSRPSFSYKFFWNYHICWIISYCSGCPLLAFPPAGLQTSFQPCQSSTFIFLLPAFFSQFPECSLFVFHFSSLLRSPLLGQTGVLQKLPVFLQNKMVYAWVLSKFSVEVSRQTFPSHGCFTADFLQTMNRERYRNLGHFSGAWGDVSSIASMHFILFPPNWPLIFFLLHISLLFV